MAARRYHWSIAIPLLLGTLWSPSAQAQRLLFQVLTPSGQRQVQAEVQIEVDGVWESVPLTDDGNQKEDVPGDGIYMGWFDGPYLRHHAIRLLVDQQELYYNLEKTEIDDTLRIGWSLSEGPEGLTAQRSAALRPGEMPSANPALSLIAGYGWGALCLIYVFGVLILAKIRAQNPAKNPE
ncbi:MAG: hypothetical protein ACI9VR_002820 [Cognaticolwellia sp.]|jgi:hypothetical protein